MRDIPKFDSREIGQNLRSLMKQHDMTVKDLQKILGLSCPQTIYHWLNGDSVPTSILSIVFSSQYGFRFICVKLI